MEEKFVKTIQEAGGNYLTFRQDLVELVNGRQATRDIVLHPGAVAIVAITDQEEIVLVRQFRYPVQEILHEIPAGKLDPGEDPLICAKRELAEETGYVAEKWTKLTSFYTVPGFCNETIHLFLAQDLQEKPAHPDEDELIESYKVPLTKALEKVTTGEIKDAKSITGILWALRER